MHPLRVSRDHVPRDMYLEKPHSRSHWQPNTGADETLGAFRFLILAVTSTGGRNINRNMTRLGYMHAAAFASGSSTKPTLEGGKENGSPAGSWEPRIAGSVGPGSRPSRSPLSRTCFDCSGLTAPCIGVPGCAANVAMLYKCTLHVAWHVSNVA